MSVSSILSLRELSSRLQGDCGIDSGVEWSGEIINKLGNVQLVREKSLAGNQLL